MKAARQKGVVLASAAIAKFGLPLLIATGLMIIGWFWTASEPRSRKLRSKWWARREKGARS